MSYEFHHGSELLTLCSRYKISIGEVMLRREMEDTTRTREEIFAEMKLNLDVMRTSIRTGLDPTVPTHGLMAGNESVKLARYAQNSELGGRLCGIVAGRHGGGRGQCLHGSDRGGPHGRSQRHFAGHRGLLR